MLRILLLEQGTPRFPYWHGDDEPPGAMEIGREHKHTLLNHEGLYEGNLHFLT